MRCPYCHYTDSKVIDSRDTPDNDGIRRRRECLRCTQRYTTYERVQPVSLAIIKKDSRREEYSRSKLTEKVQIACSKRPISTQVIDHLVDEVETELFRTGEGEVPSQTIGELVLEKLRQIDQIAYIRFASVYRNFSDLGSIKQELEALERPKTAAAPNNGKESGLSAVRPRRTEAKKAKRQTVLLSPPSCKGQTLRCGGLFTPAHPGSRRQASVLSYK